MIDRVDMGDDDRRPAAETLAEMEVAFEELRAQNAQLVVDRVSSEDARQRDLDLFDAVPDGYLVTNEEGTIRAANAAACSLFGRARDQVIGTSLASYIDAADHGAFYTQLSRIGHADAGGHLAINLAIHDIGTIPVNLRATQATAGSGGRGEIRWLVRDRRHDVVSEPLRVSEERLRSLLETARVGIMLCDLDGEVLFANQCADRILGRDPRDTTAPTWLRTTHPDDRRAVQAMLEEVKGLGRPGSIRHRLLDQDGSLRWVDHSVTPFRDGDDHFIGYVSTLVDVTIEHDAMAHLADSHNLNAALLDTVGALIVVLDPTGRIVTFNKTCESVTGFSARDMIGRSLVDSLVPIEQRDSVRTVILELNTVAANSFENDWITAEGRRRTISWTNTHLTDPDGVVTAIIGTGIDVTDSHLIESRLAQAGRLASIGRLTAGIAHDFNNTLATLRLRFDRLEARDLDDDSRADIDAALNTIDRAQTLIGDLLSFSSQQRLSAAVVELNAEIRRLEPVLSDLVGTDIEVVLDLIDADSRVRVDPARLEQVLTNLAINARDAMSGGGTLIVRTSVESIEPRSAPSVRVPAHLVPGDYVVVTVADTGMGIATDDLPKVFDPYFTTKPPGRGTGLGLATAYGTVSQSGGSILVDSQPGRGSTFRVWLPRFGGGPRTPAPAPGGSVPEDVVGRRSGGGRRRGRPPSGD